MFIIRYPYSHQYKSVIVIVYWSEYPDEVISRTFCKVCLCLLNTKPTSNKVNQQVPCPNQTSLNRLGDEKTYII